MSDTPATADRDDQSRRGFLKTASVTAAVAGAGVVGAGMITAGDASARPATVPAAATEPLVAYVRDAHTGEIAVMVGERQVIVHDRDLAARIARAAY